jgi:hypothetical protein
MCPLLTWSMWRILNVFCTFWINFPWFIMWLPISIDAFLTTWLIWSQTNILVMFMVINFLCYESILHDYSWEILGSFEGLSPHINGLVGLIIVGLVVTSFPVLEYSSFGILRTNLRMGRLFLSVDLWIWFLTFNTYKIFLFVV